MASKRDKKTVRIIARCEFKRVVETEPRKVIYLVRPSSGEGQYETFMRDGKALSCTCPARKPCYHMRQLAIIEAARAERKAKTTVEEQVVLLLSEKAASLVSRRGREFQIAMDRQLRSIEAARAERKAREAALRGRDSVSEKKRNSAPTHSNQPFSLLR
jgi:hypothetical protein